MDNLAIYNACRSVPEEAQKRFNNGRFSGTDINPMWRIKKLTETFGAAGIGWYYEVLSERAEEHGDMTIAVVDLNLYVKHEGEWSRPIYGTGGNVLVRKGATSDEGYKMALTDALSVACKALGIGADIYFDKDKTKYTAATSPQDAPQAEPEPEKPKRKASKPAEPAPAPEEPKSDDKLRFVCEECGGWMKPVLNADGTVKASLREIAEKTKKTYGKTLCIACARKAKDAMKEGKESA